MFNLKLLLLPWYKLLLCSLPQVLNKMCYTQMSLFGGSIDCVEIKEETGKPLPLSSIPTLAHSPNKPQKF